MGFFDKLKQKKSAESINSVYDTTDRYQLEHVLLPRWIAGEDGASTIAAILEQKGAFFTNVYRSIHKNEEQYSCPYSPKDFKVQGLRIAEKNHERLVLHIQMPQPERVPLCSSVFIVHDEQFENRRYITIELSVSGGFVICEWKGGAHSIYSSYSETALHSILMEYE